MHRFAFAILLLAACGMNQKHTTPDQVENHVSQLVQIKEGHGLILPEFTRETIGLKIVDVFEGQALREIELPLRVFEIKTEASRSYLFASGSVDTNLVQFLRPGTIVRPVGDSSETEDGEILSINPAAARLTGMAEVVVRFPSSRNLKAGAFLDATVSVPTPEEVVLIPEEAVLKTAEGHFAYVVNGDSLFRTGIGVGGQEGGIVEVTEGLYAGDRVASHPIMSLWLAELQAIRGGKACADGH